MKSRGLIWVVLTIAAAAICCCCPRGPRGEEAVPRSTSAQGGPAEGLKCYLAQLHLHGHSNHNGNALPASMESHSSEAKRNGLDVVWWTDHTELFDGLADLKIDFTAASMDSGGKAIILGARQGRQLSSLRLDRPDGGVDGGADGGVKGGVDARLDSGSLLVRVTSGAQASSFHKVRLTPASRLGSVRVIKFCRPAASGLTLDAYLGVEGFDPDCYVAFLFDFAWHPGGRHRARFDGVATAPGAPVRTDDTTVAGQFALPAASGGAPEYRAGLVSIDLESALRLLPQGADNTLSSFSLEIGSRNGKSLLVRLDSLVIRSTRPAGADQFATVEALSEEYSERFGLDCYVGIEIGKIHTPRAPHMNGYLPAQAQSYENLYLGWKSTRERWIEQIHACGGLVSLNHPFGASRNPRGLPSDDENEYEDGGEDGAAVESPRVLAASRASASEAEFWQVADAILEGRGLGADLLEVGYIYRGIGSLEDHLRLWDLLLANGIPLVGTGTSDSHGGVWGPDMVPNPFGTWIWAETADAADLIEALRRGHAAFGDPFNFKSDFAFMAAGGEGRPVMMGDTLAVPAASKVSAWAVFDPVPEGVEVEVVEVKIAPGKQIQATRRRVDGRPYQFSVAAGDSCFVRLEVRATDGTPLVFSNPIYVFPEE